MARNYGDKVSWSDIMDLYNRAISEQERFGLIITTNKDTDNTGKKTLVEDIKTLKDLVQILASSSYVGPAADTAHITIPSSGEVMRPYSVNQLEQIIENIEYICPYDIGVSFTSNFGQPSFAINFGFGFNTFSANFGLGSSFATNFGEPAPPSYTTCFGQPTDASNYGQPSHTANYGHGIQTNSGCFGASFTFSFATNYAAFTFGGSYSNAGYTDATFGAHFADTNGTYNQFDSNNVNGFTAVTFSSNFSFNFTGSYSGANTSNFSFNFTGSYSGANTSSFGGTTPSFGSNFGHVSFSSNFSFGFTGSYSGASSHNTNFGFNFTGSYR